jgi:hypothetical protein
MEIGIMRKLIAVALCSVLLAAPYALAQPLTYDLYYVLPGEGGTGGADIGFATPTIAEGADLSSFEVMGKYALTDWFELGARASLGFMSKNADGLSAVTAGAKYSLADMTALTVNVSALNEADQLGISAGLMNSMIVGGLGLNSHAVLAWGDGYTADGALVDMLVQPVLPLGEQTYAYLDLLLATDTQEPADRLSLIVGPNLDYELMPGLVLNGGIQFSLYSGKAILHDTDLGMVVSLFRTAALH